MTLKIIAGKWKGQKLKIPKGETTRPTKAIVRGSLFNMCQDIIAKARFLDLFAGSGAMGIEALSRGAAQVVFVEKGGGAVSCIRDNFHHLGIKESATIYPCDYKMAMKQLKRQQDRFHIIFVDPPYGYPLLPILQELIQYEVIAPQGIVFVEQAAKKPEVVSLPCLSCTDERRFGDTLLQKYENPD
jgi:16S rRNA (guanine966-N2)-methyltransferase